MIPSQILGIVGSQISHHTYQVGRCLSLENLKKLNICQQELGNLVEFIETNEHLEEEFKTFEDEFEQDEI